MSAVGRDLRYAVRSLLKHRAFTLMAIVTLGLGIGAATTIFSVIQNVLLDPLPVRATRTERQPGHLGHEPRRNGDRTFFRVG